MDIARPKYGVYAFFINHESLILNFLNSIKDADEIILCNAGSIDNTARMIETFISENPKVNIKVYPVYISPWRYDDIRNIGMSLVSRSIDLCICMNIEENLVPEWKTILDSYYEPEKAIYEYYVEEEKEDSVNTTTERKIHRNRGCFWKYPVYERLITEEENTLLIPHVIKKKTCWDYEHNVIGLLEQYIKEEPQSWVPLFHLARVLLDRGNHKEAHQTINRAIQLDGCDKSELYELKAKIYLSQGLSEEALHYLSRAIIYKNKFHLYIEQAKILSGVNRHLEAYVCLKKAKELLMSQIDHPSLPVSDITKLESFMEAEKELALEEMNS